MTDMMRAALRIAQDNRGKQPLPAPLDRRFAEVVANQWAWVGLTKADPASRDEARWLAKRLAWMTNSARHHGQQAQQLAEKTIRGLHAGHLDYADLFARCWEYRTLRWGGIRRKRALAVRVPSWQKELPSCGGLARRLISDSDIERTGRAMGNCLADPQLNKYYREELRNGPGQPIVIEVGCDPVVLLHIGEQYEEQVKGVSNSRPIEYREALIELLIAGYEEIGVCVGECDDLHRLGISDEIITGHREHAIEKFATESSVFEVGRGFLVQISGVETRLLRSAACDSMGSIYEVDPSDDFSDYMQQATARSYLRAICRTGSDFAKACDRAFRDAPPSFREDWFGFLQHPLPPPPRIRMR